jgi:Iap family predicted aminopeptidase
MLDDVPFANRQREARALRLLEAVGCDRLERQFVSEQYGHNLICEINGQRESPILVGAHHDKYGVSNGIADNWTGVASVVSLAHYFMLNNPGHTMRFVLFSG